MSKISTKKLITLGVLVAMDVVLTRFLSLNAWNTRIGFGFVPMVIAALIYGPLSAGVVGALADFIGAILFPTGPYFPGFTFSMFLMGLVFGFFLYKKKAIWRVVISVVITQFVISLFLTTYWIHVLYGAKYVPLLATRVVQSGIISAAQIIVIPLLIGATGRLGFLTEGPTKESGGMTAQEAIDYIENYTWSATKLGIERTQELLKLLGKPEKELKFIHVTGSNGKGSTCAMLASILQQAGYKTGLYTSPYIQEFRERIQINGQYIPGADLAALTAEIRDLAEGMADHPSQFELVTALAIEYFRREKCDIVVLEVGMGGALDATNAIPAPEVAVITNVGLEHTEYLGDTLEAIAATKSGIIKPGCSAVCYDGAPEVTAVVKAVCEEKNVPLICLDFTQLQPLSETLEGQRFLYRGREYFIPLLGPHQVFNTSVALETVNALRARGWKISDDNVDVGLRFTRWPARFEVLRHDPLCILDGGHNPQCAQALVNSLDRLLPGRKAVFLMGILADKDYKQVIDLILPYASEFFTLTPLNPRALESDALAEELSSRGASATACHEIDEGIDAAVAAAGPDGLVVIFGSLYLAGAVRTAFQTRIKAAKAAQRAAGRAARRNLPMEQRTAKSAVICARLKELPEVQNAKTIFSYLAMPDEVNLAEFHAWAEAQGKRVAFPLTGKHGQMEVYIPGPEGGMVNDRYGISAPDPEKSTHVDPGEIDVVIVPMVGFDKDNNRMGQGGGYYDRYLMRCPHAAHIAVAFAEQEFDAVVTDYFDMKVDAVVTDKTDK